jgi:hypothetical protein
MAIARLLPLLGPIAFVGCLGSTHPDRGHIVANATKVEVFRIDPMSRSDPDKLKVAEKSIGGYQVTSQGNDQGNAFAIKLADILADEATYTDGMADCYNPGVVFRAWVNDQPYDAVICFKCSNFYFGPSTHLAKPIASFGDSPRRADLVRLAKEAFPDDTDIQKLKE